MSDAEQLTEVAKAICDENGFEFVDRVGAGTFKETYHVRNAEQEPLALKVYNSRNRNARVQREVDAMARCNHPNIAQFDLLSEFQLGDIAYMYSLEEFISGVALESRLAGRLLSRPDVLSMGSRLIDAVSHIAGLGLVHRDLKPANIMVRDGDGAPVIVDFGLVRNLDDSSLTATWIPQGPGTPLFAPSEQLNNEKPLIDWRADQFALGVVLTMSLTGRHPYEAEGDHPRDIVERVSARGTAPEWFAEWADEQNLAPLEKMVQVWPVQRYRRPTELADAWAALE